MKNDKRIAELIAYMRVQEAEGDFILATNCKGLKTVRKVATHYNCPCTGPWVNSEKKGDQHPFKYDSTLVAIPADTTLPLKEASKITVLREVTLKKEDTRHLDLETWAQENGKTGDWVVLRLKPRTLLNRLTKRPVTILKGVSFLTSNIGVASEVEPVGIGAHTTIFPNTLWLYPADVEVNLPPCEFDIVHEFTVEPSTRRVTFGDMIGKTAFLNDEQVLFCKPLEQHFHDPRVYVVNKRGEVVSVAKETSTLPVEYAATVCIMGFNPGKLEVEV